MDTFRKWLFKPKADDKSLLARFYHADRALTAVASELDSFDGRIEPNRCTRLVTRLRQGQDKVLSITNQIMEELLGDDRASRPFRAKFPEEVLQGNLAGQLWFGAECLAAGSSIMNRELESTEMRPLAKAVTKSLDNVRNLLRDQCLRNNIPNSLTLKLNFNDASTEQLYESLKIFDRLFAEFEYRYVSAMVQVKSKHEYEMQELISVLFSETLQRALKINLLEQEQVDAYDPALMFSIPRLAIITGLVIFNKGPLNMDMPADQLSEMFRPFRPILIKIRDFLRTLQQKELYKLEKLLCTNEDFHLKSNKTNCDEGVFDEKSTNDEDLVNNIVDNNNCTNREKLTGVISVIESLVLSTSSSSSSSDWVDNDSKDIKEDLVTADCTSGYLIPNTNLGNLLQPNENALSNNFISSDEDYSETRNNNNNQSIPKSEDCLCNVNEYDNINQNTGCNNNILNNKKLKNCCNTEPSCSKMDTIESSDESVHIRCTLSSNESLSIGKTSNSDQSFKKSRRTVHRNKKHHHSKKSSRNNFHVKSKGDISSSLSDADPQEANRVLRTAGRMKFKNTENLLHRLFVCIAGVADQLQTNFAYDLRQILRSVFLMNTTPITDEITITKKQKQSDLFEFRASENDVIQENGGSNQSIYSAEEANPELDDVFIDRNLLQNDSHINSYSNNISRSRSLGEANNDQIRNVDSIRSNSFCERCSSQGSNSPISSSGSSSPRSRTPTDTHYCNEDDIIRNTATHRQSTNMQSPPTWIPDEDAPRCMACTIPFTAFRRRHHCRNCGGVFCGRCSNSTAPLPKFGLIKAVRVCRDCYVREVGT